MSSGTGGWSFWGSSLCIFCFAPIGLLITQNKETWSRALAEVNDDYTNRIRDLQQADVKEILQKLVGKCVKYRLNKEENNKHLIRLVYWDKGETGCDWKVKKVKGLGQLSEEELTKLEGICEHELWKDLTKAHYPPKYTDHRFARYNVCLNFAVKMQEKQ